MLVVVVVDIDEVFDEQVIDNAVVVVVVVVVDYIDLTRLNLSKTVVATFVVVEFDFALVAIAIVDRAAASSSLSRLLLSASHQ